MDWAAELAFVARPPLLSLLQGTRYPTTRDKVSGDCYRGLDAAPNSPNVLRQSSSPQGSADIRGTAPLALLTWIWAAPRYMRTNRPNSTGWTADGKWCHQPPDGRAKHGSVGGDIAETGPLTSCNETVPWSSTRGHEEERGHQEVKDGKTGGEEE